MRSIRLFTVATVCLAALIAAAAASGVGPWPGLAQSVTSAQTGIRYTASRTGAATTVRALRAGQVLATAQLDGSWGIPAVTSTGVAGGLSPDSRLLVLSEQSTAGGLRSQSRFQVLSTRSLEVAQTIVLPGEFGFDALSADARTLYLIQHRSRADLVAYVVRGYDLQAKRLLPGVIVAKGEGGSMRGYPVARATARSGSWVYTLYNRGSGSPFIHALNTDGRFAVCIDLTWQPASNNIWLTRLQLSADGRKLVVRSGGAAVATVDTKTFRVR
jgi:hypothetical protein